MYIQLKEEMCVFCEIINKNIPAEYIYEDEDLIVIKDNNPSAEIHFLAIPKKHISSINELEEEDARVMGKIIYRAKKIAEKEGFADNGYKVIANVGEGGGQSVFHIHFHILSGKFLRNEF